jgi:hypothetical protein
MPVLYRIEKFLRTTEMPPTVFGRRAIGDPWLVRDLRDGREPRSVTVSRIEAFLASQAGRGR